jgi:hypothetical protein
MKKKRFLTESDRKQILADKEKSIVENFSKIFDKIKRIDEYFHDSPSLPNQQMIDWVKKTLHNSAPIELSASFRGMGNEKSINNIMDDFFSRFEKDLDGLSYTDKYKIYLSAREASK